MANVEFGTGKTVLILTTVAACFAVLWPKIFYPMLVAPPSSKTQSDDINGHLRQERPIHLRPEIMHPALRERGRAIPQSSVPSKISVEKEAGTRPPPIPGTRPPMGGAGHVVPPPKTGATMNIVMPLYTIGIVIFSMYTIMKVFIRKTGNSDNYKDFRSDPEFRRVVFADEYNNGCAGTVKDEGLRSRSKRETSSSSRKTQNDDGTRLGDVEIDYLRKRLEETERAMERIVAQIGTIPAKIENSTQKDIGETIVHAVNKAEKKKLEEICTEEISTSAKKDSSKGEQVDKVKKSELQYHSDGKGDILHEPVGADYAEDDSRPKVKVMGVETVAECESGFKWSRPATPNLGVGGQSRGAASPPIMDPEPQDIFLEGSLPSQSQLLVTDSKTQTLTLSAEDGPEPPIILSGKVTLSLISLEEDGSTQRHPTTVDNIRRLPQEKETHPSEIECENAKDQTDEKLDDDALTNYTTATMSDGAEAAVMPETEDTGADVSNMDVLDPTEDQDELQDDENVWNGENRDQSGLQTSNDLDMEKKD